LDEEVQNLAFVVDGAPEPGALPPDDHRHLIEVPMIAGPGAGAVWIGGDGGCERQEPAAHGLVGLSRPGSASVSSTSRKLSVNLA